MFPALLVASQWTASFLVASGCWAVVIKIVDFAVDKAVDSLEEEDKGENSNKSV